MQKRVLVLLLLLIVLLPAAGCSKQPAESKASSKLTVYTSFFPLYDFTRKIGGSHVNVINLVPTGANVHDWEPGPKTLAALLEADLLVVNGLGIEPWLSKIDAVLEGKVPIVNTSEGVSLLYGFQGHRHHAEHHAEDAADAIPDPHIWLDPVNALHQAEIIAAALMQHDPEHAEIFAENLAAFRQEIKALDQEYRDTLQAAPRREFVVTHLAFAYLAKRYELEQRAISGLTPQAEPSPGQMEELVRFMREHDIHYIFQEPFTSERLTSTLAREVGAEVLILHPAAALTAEEEQKNVDYFTIMRQNLAQLAKALSN